MISKKETFETINKMNKAHKSDINVVVRRHNNTVAAEFKKEKEQADINFEMGMLTEFEYFNILKDLSIIYTNKLILAEL